MPTDTRNKYQKKFDLICATKGWQLDTGGTWGKDRLPRTDKEPNITESKEPNITESKELKEPRTVFIRDKDKDRDGIFVLGKEFQDNVGLTTKTTISWEGGTSGLRKEKRNTIPEETLRELLR